jgi:hypothetical protein
MANKKREVSGVKNFPDQIPLHDIKEQVDGK